MGQLTQSTQDATHAPAERAPRERATDESIMGALVAFTARSFRTSTPVPFGAAIVNTASGVTLLRARNAVIRESDPSSHAELRAVRLACKKLRTPSLAGYTLYSTCEPCPMCMANALWAGIDRLVYGATIADASRHCKQIHIPATEVASRSDMQCSIEGEVARAICLGLFHHPKMLEAFATWSTRKG